jgi:hypothetical protein
MPLQRIIGGPDGERPNLGANSAAKLAAGKIVACFLEGAIR